MKENHLLETAIRAAQVGGQLALSRLGKPGYLKWKGPGDLLAEAVLEVQDKIAEVIRQDFPDASLLMEEGEGFQDDQADPLWIVDPVDGSLNFYHGIPQFAVSIGYRSNGIYRMGVIYDPSRNELFYAILNQGAYLNGRQIQVDQFADGQDALHAAMVGTDWKGGFEELKSAFQLLRLIAGEVRHVQTFGSPALGFCYVAAGRLHAYYGLGHIKVWDVAAAAVILQEAGATLTDIDGGPWLYADEGYLATNGIIHGSMLGIISAIRRLQQRSKVLRA